MFVSPYYKSYFCDIQLLKGRNMEIKVLGSGCAKCKKLQEITEEATKELGLQANVVKEEDMMAIMSYGVVRTPALIINEKVALSGRVPSLEELKKLISQHG